MTRRLSKATDSWPPESREAVATSGSGFGNFGTERVGSSISFDAVMLLR